MSERRALIEQVNGYGTIDEAEGYIRGVKVLGPTSKNGYPYSEKARRTAVSLYEGLHVFEAHVDKDDVGRDRTRGEWVGVLRNLRFESDGYVYADLQCRTKLAGYQQLIEDARKFPDKFGLSAHQLGVVDPATGEVLDLAEASSVDLVMKPATVKGLFEAIQTKESPMLAKFRTVVSTAATKSPLITTLQEAIDGGSPIGDVEMTVPEPAGMDDALSKAFADAVMAVLSDPKLDMAAKKQKINALLGAQEKVSGTVETPAPKDPPKEEPKAEAKQESIDPKVAAQLAKLTAENAQLKAEGEVRSLFESVKVAPSPIQLKAAIALPSEDRKAFVDSVVATLQESTDPNTPPRSSGSGGETAPAYPKSAEEFAAALR